jgi:hypothetical protein
VDDWASTAPEVVVDQSLTLSIPKIALLSGVAAALISERITFDCPSATKPPSHALVPSKHAKDTQTAEIPTFA